MYDLNHSSLWQSADQVGFEKEDCFGIVFVSEYSFGPRVTSLSLRSGNFLILLQRLGPGKFRTCKWLALALSKPFAHVFSTAGNQLPWSETETQSTGWTA